MQLLPELKKKTPYQVMLDRLEMAVQATQPCGFNRILDESAYQAKQDVLQAINNLRAGSFPGC